MVPFETKFLGWDVQSFITLVFPATLFQVCSEEEGLIEPWDYTPFYYLIECGAFLLAVSHIVFVNPTMRRSMLDRDESK